MRLATQEIYCGKLGPPHPTCGDNPPSRSLRHPELSRLLAFNREIMGDHLTPGRMPGPPWRGHLARRPGHLARRLSSCPIPALDQVHHLGRSALACPPATCDGLRARCPDHLWRGHLARRPGHPAPPPFFLPHSCIGPSAPYRAARPCLAAQSPCGFHGPPRSVYPRDSSTPIEQDDPGKIFWFRVCQWLNDGVTQRRNDLK